MKDYMYIDSEDDDHQFRFRIVETPKIDSLMEDKRFDEALVEIDRLLEDDASAENWNVKGIVLDNLERYWEAVDCFNQSLQLNDSNEVKSNLSRAFYNWAKVSFFPEGDYDKALSLIDDALKALPKDSDASEYYFLKAEILEGLNMLVESHRNYLIAYNELDRLDEFDRQTKYIEENGESLFNIVGCDFYNYDPKPGSVVDLVFDDDNEHDPEAVAVLVDGDVVGYVANSDYTLLDGVNGAGDVRRCAVSGGKAMICFVYLGEYVVCRLI